MAIATAIGYGIRRCSPGSARLVPIAQHIGIYITIPLIALIGLFTLDLRLELLWLPLLFLILSAVWLVIGQLAVRLHSGLTRADQGSYVLAATLTNCGPTMITSLAYVLARPADRCVEALALAQLFALPWTFWIFTVGFPLGATYGHGSPRFTFRRWIREVVHPRSLGLVAAIVAILLNLFDRAHPQFALRDFHTRYLLWLVLPVLVVQNAAFYFAIGHSLHVGQVRRRPSLHLSLAAVKFFISPLIAAAILALLQLAGVRLSPLAQWVVMFQAIAPTAVFGTVISQAAGLNTQLASLLFVVNTLVFLILILPLFLWVAV